MKLLSTLSLGSAAAAVLMVAAATPADAQRRRDRQAEQPAAAPGTFTPTLGAEFRAAIAPADEAATAQNWAAANAGLATAAPLATTPDEKYTLGQVRLRVGVGTNDKAIQRAALQEIVDSGVGPAEQLPRFRFFLGNLAYEANDNAAAERYLREAIAAGYNENNIQLMLANVYFRSNQIPQGLQLLEQLIQAERTAGRVPPQDWYRRGASVAYQAQNWPEVAKWTRLQVEAYPTPENWRSVLVIYEEANEQLDSQVMLDLYRLKRASGALTSERDYYTYAQLAYDRGLFGEAKAVVDEGVTGGDVQRTAPAFAQIYTPASQRVTADRRELTTAQSRVASASAADALDTANVLLAYGENQQAADAYRVALQKGGIDTNLANMRLGIALARLGQGEPARAAFAQVTGVRQPIAQFWTLYAGQRGGTPAAPPAATPAPALAPTAS